MKKINNTLISILNKVFNNKIFSNKIFTSKITLIVVAAIAFLSLYRNIMLYEFSAVLLFFVVAAIAYNFTKNMTIVLGTSFLATIIVGMFKGLFGFKEGLEGNKSNNPLDAMSKMAEELTAGDDENAAATTTPTTDSTTTLPSAPARPRTTPAPAPTQAETTTTAPTTTTRAAPNATTTAPATSGYQNQIPLNPGLYTMPNKEQLTKQLGKATETEQAYDNLEKIMGQKNLQTMSSDTQNLIRQQNELIKQLKSMTPALNEAMNALGGLDLSKLTGMFNRPQE